MTDPRRALPPVDGLVGQLEERRPDLPLWALREAARRALADARARLARGEAPGDLAAAGLAAAEALLMGIRGVMNFTLQNAERCPTTGAVVDALEILGHEGDDILDAGAVAPDSEAPDDRRDLLARRLFGDVGNDRLIGSAFDDYLDSGQGDDTVSGLRGVDTFCDAGGFDTLLETNDADMGLFGDTFVAGRITGLGKGSQADDLGQPPVDPLFPAPFVTELTGTGDTWAAGAEVESLSDPESGLIFEKANIKDGRQGAS